MASQQMEQLKQIMQRMMASGFAPKFDGTLDPMQLRSVIQAAQDHMALEPGVTYIPEKFGEMDAELSMPENPRDDAIVVYIHGGGLICGNALSSRGYASMLAGESRFPVYSFSYRLAPENKFPAAIDDCFEAYKIIEARYPDKPIFLIGESGGAYLSIVTAMMARDHGVRMPAGIVPYSPPIELIGMIDRHFPGNKDFTVNPDALIWLGSLYYDDLEIAKTNIYASPYLDDMHGMCPVFLAWDESESLAMDAQVLVEKLKEAGVEYEAYSYPDCFHAFATTGRGTPESYEVMKNTIKFFEKHI